MAKTERTRFISLNKRIDTDLVSRKTLIIGCLFILEVNKCTLST